MCLSRLTKYLLSASAATQAVLGLALLGPRKLAGSAGGAGPPRSAIDQQLHLKQICTSWKPLSPIISSWEGVTGWPGGKDRVIVFLWLIWRRKIQKMSLGIPALQERGRDQLSRLFFLFYLCNRCISKLPWRKEGRQAWERERKAETLRQ